MTSSATPADSFSQQLLSIGQLIDQRNLRQAAEQLNRVSKLAPSDPRIYILGSRLAEFSGNAKGAEEMARKAHQLAPQWHVTVTELSSLLARLNRLPEALTLAELAIQMAPDNAETLGRAIDVAHRAQNFSKALDWLDKAVALAPDNLLIQHMIARDLQAVGEHDSAIDKYSTLVNANPADVLALRGRLKSALARGQMDTARSDAAALLALNPESDVDQFWSTLAEAQTPHRLPASMVRELFDSSADLHDLHTLTTLQYRLPQDVADLIKAEFGDRTYSILDLGCGTGLLGMCLGRIQGFLVGADLSEKMMEQAARHNVYDKFHHVDVLDAVQATPDNHYEILTALDVVPYLGDLQAFLPGAYRIAKPGGSVIFSFDEAPEDGPDLAFNSSLRFTHKPSAVEAACRAVGFETVQLDRRPMYVENGQPVSGCLVVARKAAALH